jgi:hypothetical protein
MALSKDEVVAKLAAKEFSALIGELENEWLECKQFPYQLDTDRQKLELAKDVSGLANASGGLLLIGFATGKDVTHGADRIDEAKPFPLQTFDAAQYVDIIRAWTQPALSVTVEIHPSEDTDKGYCCIVVPAVSAADRPVLVAKTLVDDDKRTGVVFGYCERKQGNVQHYDVARLQSALRDGLRLDDHIRDGFQSLQVLLKTLTETAQGAKTELPAVVTKVPALEQAGSAVPAPRPLTFTNNEIEARTAEALRVVGLSIAPALVLRSIPAGKMDIRELFESKTAPLVKLLEQPISLRDSGFDLSVDGASHIVAGSLRRSVSPEAKLLEVHRDGMVIFITRGDDGGLCWGRKERQATANLINQLVLVETVYLFFRFCYAVYDATAGRTSAISVELELLRTSSEGRDCVLERGAISDWGGTRMKPAPGQSKTFSITVNRTIDSPERSALLLLSEIYAWFGFEEDQIPYTAGTGGDRVIDPEGLVAAGKRRY